MAKRRATSWANCKKAVKDWPRDGLTLLLKELYDLSAENRDFLHARLLPEHLEEAMASVEKKLAREIKRAKSWSDTFRHADAKRVVEGFRKFADSPELLARLLVFDLGQLMEVFDVGQLEPLADHFYWALAELGKLYEQNVPMPVDTLVALAEQWKDQFGYGVSDELYGFAMRVAQERDEAK